MPTKLPFEVMHVTSVNLTESEHLMIIDKTK